MARKVSVVVEKDDNGFYVWCPELKGCQSQGATLEGAIANSKEAVELYLETLPICERDVLLSREILTTAVVPFHSGATLHPKVVKQVLETIQEAGQE